MKRPYFRTLESNAEEHPIDQLVQRRLGKRGDRKLAALSNAVVEALGPQSSLWFAHEEVRAELRFVREAAYFDAGVEHGIAAAAAGELKTEQVKVQHLARRLAHEALGARLREEDALAAVLLAAWSLLGAVRLSKRAR